MVYGGTASGVITAVAAAREGLSVALLEPRRNLGGMVSGGLGQTDVGQHPELIGGYAREFFENVSRFYGREFMRKFNQNIKQRADLGDVGWYFEPHVAEKVFNDMAKAAGVEVFYNSRLRQKSGVLKVGTRITEIRLEDSERFTGEIFVDASYEGDLMAQSGVSYTWGRESIRVYHESLAGVRPETPNHNFATTGAASLGVRISAYDMHGKLLLGIYPGPKGSAGEGDRKVQAYNFRICLTNDKAKKLPYPRPKNYQPLRYELLLRLLKAFVEKNGRSPHMNELVIVSKLPNDKTDINNRGPFSTNDLNMSWEYPNANYRRRTEIWQDHVDYVQGFLYFLSTDSRVPHDLQDEVNEYGLAKDEFVDNNHWPPQLYIREARRMVGDFVMKQRDIQGEGREKADVIGMGAYNSDSHNVQRLATPDGYVENEGNMEVPVEPYQIPYRVILPKRREATNLLVPVCLSASHVAYSTLRMEPQYMIIGHAAGLAAKMAIQNGSAVQDVNAKALSAKLWSQGAILESKPATSQPRVKVKPSRSINQYGFGLAWFGYCATLKQSSRIKITRIRCEVAA